VALKLSKHLKMECSNDLKSGEYIIRKVQDNQAGMELNETHKLLVYTDDVNLSD
jgi:hypothetical protein